MVKKVPLELWRSCLGAGALVWVAVGCGNDADAEGEPAAGGGEARVLSAKETRGPGYGFGLITRRSQVRILA